MPRESRALNQSSLRHKDKKPKLLHSQAILQAPQTSRPVKVGPSSRKVVRTKQRQADPGSLRLPATAKAAHTQQKAILDPWSAGSTEPVHKHPKSGRRCLLPAAFPLEVDRPGSSYNPDCGQHEEVLADAVAAEVTKANQQLLQAVPPPKLVLQGLHTDDELALLQVGQGILVMELLAPIRPMAACIARLLGG